MANQVLHPAPRRGLRLGIFMGLCALVLIGTTTWLQKLGFLAGAGLILGTFRQFRASPKTLRQYWTVGFIRLPPKQWRLRRYTRIEIRYERPTGIEAILLFGPIAFVYGWIVDRCFAWIGGCYQIWLRDDADNGVLAWQGNSQRMYEQNLDLLKSITGLSINAR